MEDWAMGNVAMWAKLVLATKSEEKSLEFVLVLGFVFTYTGIFICIFVYSNEGMAKLLNLFQENLISNIGDLSMCGWCVPDSPVY